MGALDTLNSFIDGPLAHSANTLTVGSMDNREVLRYEYNERGDYVSQTLAEQSYRKDAMLGQVVAGAAGTSAFVGVRSAGTKWGLFAPFGSTATEGAAIAKNLTMGGRIARSSMIGISAGILGIGVALPYLTAATTALDVLPTVAGADIPLVSDFANRFQPTYLEPDEFAAEVEAEETAAADDTDNG